MLQSSKPPGDVNVRADLQQSRDHFGRRANHTPGIMNMFLPRPDIDPRSLGLTPYSIV